MKLSLILVCASCILLSIPSFSQGCSDAGFCTMGAMRPDQNFNRRVDFKLRSLAVQYHYGKSTLSPVIQAYTLDFDFGVTQNFGVHLKLPYQRVTGNLGENQGIGDISISATYLVYSHSLFDINATLGGKIPTNNSNAKAENGLTLPMYYQTSLGSYDIIAGASLISRNWLFAVGYQQALTANENDFTWAEWVRYPSQNYINSHDVGIGLIRGIDVMMRVERNFRWLNYSFNVGLLPIYRVTKDTGLLRTKNNTGKLNTRGLALTAITGFTYNFNVVSGVKVLYGLKITDRDTNPDGLTRDWVLNLTYEFRF